MLYISLPISPLLSFFFFNDTATTEIYTLSLHDALPICPQSRSILTKMSFLFALDSFAGGFQGSALFAYFFHRSEEHTSELQSLRHLVCRLLLEKKKQQLTPLSVCHEPARPCALG